MSLQSLLSIARSALDAQQRAMTVAAHNVANATTPGYHRQRLTLTAAEPLRGPLYPLGRGVEAPAIERAHNTFWDASYRLASGQQGLASTLHDYLSSIEGAMNEPGDQGLQSTLDGFLQSFSDLSNDPANPTNRTLVVQSAQRFVQQLHGSDQQLSRASADAANDLRGQTEQVNAITTKIAQLNVRILGESGAGGVAPDLEDARDSLVDQLSQFMNVQVLQRPDGSYGVQAGDTLLVDGARSTSLSVVTVGSGFGVAPSGGGGAVSPGGGSIGALADLTQNRIPALRGQLDQLANAMVTQVNALHRTGFTLSGATNTDFFDSTGVTAGTIQLAAGILASPDNIAAAGTNAPGDGSIALAIAGLGTRSVASLGGKSMRDFWVSSVSTLGLDVQGAATDTDTSQAMLDQADQSRQSETGVNVDEEMVGLIGQQQAYQAAAHLVTVAQTLADEILKMI